MARGRLISGSLSTSRKRARLHDLAGPLAEFCQAIYPLLIVHADDFGRMQGDAFTVKWAVDPTSPRSESEFDSALTFLADVGLITRYAIAGGRFLQIVEFDAHQTGLHKRTKSKIPEVPGNSGNFQEIPGNSGKAPELPGMSGNFREIPSEEKRREEKRTEEKGTEGKRDQGETVDRDIQRQDPHAHVDRARAHENGNGRWAKPTNGKPLGIVGSHLRCYMSPACARGLCVPQHLAQKWALQCSPGDPTAADATLKTFIASALARTPDGPIGDDPLDFWRNQWATTHGTTTSKPRETKASRNIDAAKRVIASLKTQSEF